MKICQLSPFGGEPLWQRLGLKEVPKTKWLILLANIPDLKKYDNFLEGAKELKRSLEEEQKEYPQDYQVKINVLDLTDLGDNYYKVLSYFMELFRTIIQSGYQIYINGTSGLQIWRIVLYQVALINKENVGDYFIFNKSQQKRETIWLQTELNENERAILSILGESGQITLTELTKKFHEVMQKGKLSYIVKLVQNLQNAGLIEEKKEGRMKYVNLNEIGIAYISTNNWNDKITRELEID